MTRLFIDEVINDSKVVLDKENSHYISSVLRMRSGEQLIIVDSTGEEILAEVSSPDKNATEVEVISRSKNTSEPPCKVTIFQSVSKGERMTLTIQKSVELGVYSIVPVFSERCIVRMDDKDSKTDRWQKIALEAARQSGRGIVPEIMPSVKFKNALSQLSDYDVCLFPWEEEHGKTLKEVISGKLNPGAKVAVFIGPEGGFTDEEAKMAADSGAVNVTLGPRILRTETAGPAVLSMILYESEL